jgi:hypothetical protein
MQVAHAVQFGQGYRRKFDLAVGFGGRGFWPATQIALGFYRFSF